MSHDTAMDLGSPLLGVLQLGISCKNSLGASGNGNRERGKIIAWFGNLEFLSEASELVK